MASLYSHCCGHNRNICALLLDQWFKSKVLPPSSFHQAKAKHVPRCSSIASPPKVTCWKETTRLNPRTGSLAQIHQSGSHGLLVSPFPQPMGSLTRNQLFLFMIQSRTNPKKNQLHCQLTREQGCTSCINTSFTSSLDTSTT